MPQDSILLYQDEKGSIAPKTYGGPSWRSYKKLEKAHKIKVILNVFGFYDYTNDQMHTHSYKNKTRDQFLDFIKRLDRKMIPLLLMNILQHSVNTHKPGHHHFHQQH